MEDFRGPFVLVDGKQRLEAVRKFLRNELMAFGHYFRDFEGHLPSEAEFIFTINNLTSRKKVLQWYLEINSGGVVHTAEELKRVEHLLHKC